MNWLARLATYCALGSGALLGCSAAGSPAPDPAPVTPGGSPPTMIPAGGIPGMLPPGGAAGAPPNVGGGVPVEGAGGTGPEGAGGVVGAGGDGAPLTGGMDGFGGTEPNGDGGSGNASANRVPAGQLCDRVSTIQCEAEVRCCAAPGRTPEACKSALFQLCANEGYLDQITLNPITGYSPDQAEVVLNELERRASVCDPSVTAWIASVEGLRSVLLGTVAPGGSCHPGTMPDTPTQGAKLASCIDPRANGCLAESVFSFKCTPRAGAGAPCFTEANCLDGLYCDNPNLERITGSTCLPLKPDGQPCAGPGECQSVTCRQGQCVPADAQTAYCLAG